MTYSLEVTPSCQEQIKKRTAKNKPEKEALEKKVKQILENHITSNHLETF